MSGPPEGWVRARLSDICSINPRADKTVLADDEHVAFIPMSAVEAGTGAIDVSAGRTFASVRQGYTAFKTSDVLFAKITPCMENGKMAVVPPMVSEHGFGSTEFHVLRPKGGVDPIFIYHLVSNRVFRVHAEHLMTGAVGQRRVPVVVLEEHEVAVPPSNEQRRIVERVEASFAEIDHGVESLRAARRALGLYRRSLLKAAFEGRLTAGWRAANPDLLEQPSALLAHIQREREARHEAALAEWKVACVVWEEGGRRERKPAKPRPYDNVAPLRDEERALLLELPDTWEWVRIGQLFGVFVGATPSRKQPNFWGGEIRWVSSGEVQFGTIRDTREKITEAGFDNMSGEVHPPGTVMLGMIGEGKTRGQSAILACHATNNQNCAAIRVSETVISPQIIFEFLRYRYVETRRAGSGNNQPALNKRIVQALAVPLCSPAEQAEIVRILDARLSAADALGAEIEAGLKRASALRQSILTEAFAGRLVPQDPDDEPASALLERIRSERAAGAERGAAPRTRGRRKEQPA